MSTGMILMCVCFNYSQLFALYETLPDPSVKHMEGVVDIGINVVALVYFLVSSGGLSGEQGARKVSFTAFPLGKKDKHKLYTIPKDVLTIAPPKILTTRIIN